MGMLLTIVGVLIGSAVGILFVVWLTAPTYYDDMGL